MDILRRAATDAPDFRSFREDKPILLVSWWVTFYSLVIILIRACGRYVRTEKVFREDATILGAIIPLFMRMAFVHVVLLFGTNNTVITNLTVESIRQREIGSRLVIAARISYVTYLWAVKYSVSMFLRTLTGSMWKSSQHQRLLRYFHVILIVTFVAVVISTMAECQPIGHYAQVSPDPGPQCRQGRAQLFTMGILNIVTNLVLVLFPIPMILKAQLPNSHKFSILTRLALPLGSIALTCYQIPYVISQRYSQPSRSLLASMDILLSAFISNAIVLVSLLQDRGYKKTKYKHGTAKEGYNTKGGERPDTRWGSDENLVRISEGEPIPKSEYIGLITLKGDGRLAVAQVIELGPEPSHPQEVRLHEIRVCETWEVSSSTKKRP